MCVGAKFTTKSKQTNGPEVGMNSSAVQYHKLSHCLSLQWPDSGRLPTLSNIELDCTLKMVGSYTDVRGDQILTSVEVLHSVVMIVLPDLFHRSRFTTMPLSSLMEVPLDDGSSSSTQLTET